MNVDLKASWSDAAEVCRTLANLPGIRTSAGGCVIAHVCVVHCIMLSVCINSWGPVAEALARTRTADLLLASYACLQPTNK